MSIQECQHITYKIKAYHGIFIKTPSAKAFIPVALRAPKSLARTNPVLLFERTTFTGVANLAT